MHAERCAVRSVRHVDLALAPPARLNAQQTKQDRRARFGPTISPTAAENHNHGAKASRFATILAPGRRSTGPPRLRRCDRPGFAVNAGLTLPERFEALAWRTIILWRRPTATWIWPTMSPPTRPSSRLTGTIIATLVCIILELVLWGLQGHGGVALIGFALTAAAALFGGLTGANWRAVAPVMVLLGLACIVL